MELALDPGWAAGMLLATMRTGAFVLSSPVFPAGIPVVGRLGLAIALGLFFASPVPDALTLGGLLGAGVANITVGLLLGWLTGLVFAVFPVAGGIIDMTSGLGIAAVIDPNQGAQAAVFNRLFTMTALALFMVIGGDQLLVHGLNLSVEAIPLDGAIQLDEGLMAFAIQASTRMFVAGTELALPPVAALFLTEVVLGLASRFAPTANVFILGLPLRILLALTTTGIALAFFPSAGDGMMRLLRETFVAGLRGLGVAG